MRYPIGMKVAGQRQQPLDDKSRISFRHLACLKDLLIEGAPTYGVNDDINFAFILVDSMYLRQCRMIQTRHYLDFFLDLCENIRVKFAFPVDFDRADLTISLIITLPDLAEVSTAEDPL